MKIKGNNIKVYTEGSSACVSEEAWSRGAGVEFNRFTEIASGIAEGTKAEREKIYNYFNSRDDFPKVTFEDIFPTQDTLKKMEEEGLKKAIENRGGVSQEQIQAENRRLQAIRNLRREARRKAILAAGREEEQSNFRVAKPNQK